MRRRRSRRGHAHAPTELELMPLLNVFIAIIPLLLLSAAFIQVSVIQATLPGDASAAAAPNEDMALDLAVYIRHDVYVVTGRGIETQSVARNADSHDAVRTELTEMLRAIASAHPDTRELRIVSEPKTKYEEIIEVMDIARGAGLPETSLTDVETS
jgi:biopolymer transport protein ExbD